MLTNGLVLWLSAWCVAAGCLRSVCAPLTLPHRGIVTFLLLIASLRSSLALVSVFFFLDM
jgi:succinate-acetate transporter protein